MFWRQPNPPLVHPEQVFAAVGPVEESVAIHSPHQFPVHLQPLPLLLLLFLCVFDISLSP
jgi:hypothetical protein